ncbi:MAG TPA: HEAT repeat domain-containing protein [Polyangia bacterium]|nr:HEAT repeat domain-containing protein [Polyangia bacterium]
MRWPAWLPFFILWAGPALGDPGASRWQGADEPYLAGVHERIHRRWSDFLRELERLPANSPHRNPDLAAEVLIAVEPDGRISRVERTSGPGLKGFDEAPVQLLQDVARLPPPPEALLSDDGRAYLSWHFTTRAPGCEQGEVTERHLPIEEAIDSLARGGRTEAAAARVVEAVRAEPARTAALLGRLTVAMARAEAKHAEPEHRAAAAVVLGQLEEGLVPLLGLAKDPQPAVRRAALAALGGRKRFAARDAAGVVRETLVRALSTEDRMVAAQALGHLADPSTIQPLREVLRSGLAPADTAMALGDLGDRAEAINITRGLLQGDAAARQAAAVAARVLKATELAPAILEAIPASASNPALRAALLDGLGVPGNRASAEARKALLAGLRDASPQVRAHALEALLETGDRSGGMRSRAEDALSDPEAVVRAAAATVLARLGAVDEIIRPSHDRSPLVRRALAAALLAHPLEGARKLLARLEQDPDPVVKEAFQTTGGATPDRERLAEEYLGAKGAVALLQAAARWAAVPGDAAPR